MANKKSKAKASGLKSAFRINDQTLLTSFGKGNEAIIEKTFSSTADVNSLNDPAAFDVSENKNDSKFNIVPRKFKPQNVKSAVADIPRRNGDDCRIHAKAALEQEYFGRTFDDNIHIQIIYNILDINKILAVGSNNIVYTLNNITRNPESFDKDFICGGFFNVGQAYDGKAYEPFDRFYKSGLLAYFGNAFYYAVKSGKGVKPTLRSKEQVYDILSLIADIRHVCVHPAEYKAGNKEHKSNIYNIENRIADHSICESARKTLNAVFNERANEVNGTFISNNEKSNFGILFKLFPKERDKNTLAVDFYDFCIRKTYKNVGISIRQLRECLLSKHSGTCRNSRTAIHRCFQRSILCLISRFGNTTSITEKSLA